MMPLKHRLLQTPLQLIGKCVWNTAEYLGFSLGRFAPTIFGWAIGAKKKRVLDTIEEIKNLTEEK